ncbi:MAG: hypothetical protein LBL66_03595 [Clostridiales bacterium]|nr:hypothetical protein [Clostridiales bacterium]
METSAYLRRDLIWKIDESALELDIPNDDETEDQSKRGSDGDDFHTGG